MHLHAEMKSFCGMTAEQNHNSPSRTQCLNTVLVLDFILLQL